MDYYKQMLFDHQEEIVEDLRMHDILDYLIQEKIVYDEERQDILSKISYQAQTRYFLQILGDKGPHAFRSFICSLKEKYMWIAERLLEVEREYKAKAIKRKPDTLSVMSNKRRKKSKNTLTKRPRVADDEMKEEYFSSSTDSDEYEDEVTERKSPYADFYRYYDGMVKQEFIGKVNGTRVVSTGNERRLIHVVEHQRLHANLRKISDHPLARANKVWTGITGGYNNFTIWVKNDIFKESHFGKLYKFILVGYQPFWRNMKHMSYEIGFDISIKRKKKTQCLKQTQ